jgi:ferredoxin
MVIRVTRVLLRFNKDLVQEPVTSQIIMKHKTPINILSARITPLGGEMLVEINNRNADEIIDTFRKKGVIVDVSSLIEKDDDLCNECGVCVSLCPTEALHQGPEYTISLDPETCNGVTCGLCLNACPRRALHLIN